MSRVSPLPKPCRPSPLLQVVPGQHMASRRQRLRRLRQARHSGAPPPRAAPPQNSSGPQSSSSAQGKGWRKRKGVRKEVVVGCQRDRHRHIPVCPPPPPHFHPSPLLPAG